MTDLGSKSPGDLEAPRHIEDTPSQYGEIIKNENTTHDAVFGELNEGGPNYRNVSFFISSEILCMLMIR